MKTWYLDLCALKRPFDRVVDDRVLLEALAVASLLDAFEGGRLVIVSSGILHVENSRNPDPSRRDAVEDILTRLSRSEVAAEALAERARQIQSMGFQALDALHLASAILAGCEVFVTCDDMILKLARRIRSDLIKIQVVEPLEAVRLLREEGDS